MREDRITDEEDARITAEEEARSEVQVLREALQLLSQAHLRLAGRVDALEETNRLRALNESGVRL